MLSRAHRQTRLDGEIKAAAGTVDTSALAAYAAKDAEYNKRRAAFEEASAKRDAARAEHDGLKAARFSEFMAGFAAISGKLKEMYQMITLGGDAELELVDTLDPFSEVCASLGRSCLLWVGFACCSQHAP